MSSAKCHNYTGCLLAYRGEEISLPSGAPLVCPECGKPLTPVSGGGTAILKWALIGLGSLALLGAIAYLALKKPDVPVDPVGPTPRQASTPAEVTPRGDDPVIPDAKTVEVPKEVNTDLKNQVNKQVQDDVLKRIEQMPKITPENKDKLFNAVQRARGMGMILQIPFESGRTTLTAPQTGALVNAFNDPQLQKLRDDATAVFVVLGYADSKGDSQKNLDVSQARADSVMIAMKNTAKIDNVTHAVGMGGSTMHDPKSLAGNRLVEVWAVLP